MPDLWFGILEHSVETFGIAAETSGIVSFNRPPTYLNIDILMPWMLLFES